jgi:hypothetical protein
MCCSGSIEKTRKFLSKHKNHKTVTVYKVFKTQDTDYSNGWYAAPIVTKGLFAPYRGDRYYPGETNASRPENRIRKECRVNKGIHVFLTREDAEGLARSSSIKVVVKMTAQVKDLIAVGDFEGIPNNAVFKKVTLSRSEYDKHVKKEKE